jgi:hypothetical protein
MNSISASRHKGWKVRREEEKERRREVEEEAT